jgi:hypothetical protein
MEKTTIIAIAAIGYLLWKKNHPSAPASARAPAPLATAAATAVDGHANNPPVYAPPRSPGRDESMATWGGTTTTQVLAAPLAPAGLNQAVGALAAFGGGAAVITSSPHITPGWEVGGTGPGPATQYGGGVSGYPDNYNPLTVMGY